jgi:hypothetical protein
MVDFIGLRRPFGKASRLNEILKRVPMLSAKVSERLSSPDVRSLLDVRLEIKGVKVTF